jgi:hypothetical protein
MMQPEIQKRLLEINREFYDTFASSFSDTRGRVQPGVAALADRMSGSRSILDVGCGNGTLAWDSQSGVLLPLPRQIWPSLAGQRACQRVILTGLCPLPCFTTCPGPACGGRWQPLWHP